MKIYNQEKRQVLNNPDLELGYLKEDVLIHNYPEIQAVEEQGHYKTIAEYPNGGKDVEWVVDVKGVDYQPARIEEENIYVYVPYSKAELEQRSKQKLRYKRVSLLEAFDKYRSAVNYGLITETQEERVEIIEWYNNLLNLDKQTIENNIPAKISYYL